jgi:hypothetical protein
MALRRTYHPPKEFEKELADFARLCQAKGWTFPDDVIAQLIADAEAQVAESAAHEAARIEFVALHETFGLAQFARYKRFVALVQAVRGMYRDDKAVMAELEQFSSRSKRRKKARPEEAA